MRIGLVSDLHMEFGIQYYVDDSSIDYLVLAGDIGDYERVKNLLDALSVDYFYILGNHEYYYADGLPDRLRALARDRSVAVIDGVKIAGCTLWSLANSTAFKSISDSSFMTHLEYLRKHSEDVSWLASLEGADIVVTHHLPSYSVISPRWTGHPVNSAFASNVFEELPWKPKVWMFGHTHDPVDIYAEDCRFVCNPIGYPSYTDTIAARRGYSVTIVPKVILI